jgi:hypothetical protein
VYTAVRYGDVGACKADVKRLHAYFQESHGLAGRRSRGRPPAPENGFMTAAGHRVRRFVDKGGRVRESSALGRNALLPPGELPEWGIAVAGGHDGTLCLGLAA